MVEYNREFRSSLNWGDQVNGTERRLNEKIAELEAKVLKEGAVICRDWRDRPVLLLVLRDTYRSDNKVRVFLGDDKQVILKRAEEIRDDGVCLDWLRSHMIDPFTALSVNVWNFRLKGSRVAEVSVLVGKKVDK